VSVLEVEELRMGNWTGVVELKLKRKENVVEVEGLKRKEALEGKFIIYCLRFP
jgi:hypothetical protein